MPSTRIKRLLGALVLVATFSFLVYYWRAHPEILQQLQAINVWSAASIIGLYGVMTLVLVAIYDTILRLCAKPIPLGEHTLLTLYSSIVNFFGPLQSGPGFRTVYLKQRHSVSAKAYISGTLLYYLLFGLANLIFLAVGLVGLAFAPLLFLAVIIGLLALRAGTNRLSRLQRFQLALHSPLLGRLALFTLLQALIAAAIYAIELHAVGQSPNLQQILAYAGAGSLALFVSLTPAAIGFRESFQYFSQSLHGMDSAAIVAANVLDRSVYVAFLGLSFIAIITLHAHRRFNLRPESSPPQDHSAG